MTTKKLTLLLTLLWCFSTAIYAQVGELTGFDLCSDGRQTTDIGITGIDPGKYYALYRGDEMIQVRRSNTEGKDRTMSFGTFKDFGTYSAAAFDKVVEGFPPRSGKPVKGKITISRMPVLIMGDTLKIKSGKALDYTPRSDVPGTTFTWSATVKSGTVTGYTKQGAGAIHDIIRAEGDKPACIQYAITPHGADPIVSCSGEPRDLVIVIRP